MPQLSFEPVRDRQYRADVARCRAMLRDGSRTFYAASFLLPAWLREPASALYAFCRQADDSVDVNGGRLQAIATLRRRLDAAYAGAPTANAIDRAFAATVRGFAVPRALPEALLEGLAWDAAGRQYDSIDALNAYAARVAGSVGAMMAVLMGVRSPDLMARACDLGIAMQLTNIARDVGEDARNGRIYLPLAWMREAGLDPQAWLSKPDFSPQLATVVERLLATADEHYARADAGIARLPSSCRPGIRAARLLYAEIGEQVRRLGGDSVTSRAVVPVDRKLRLVADALWASRRAQAQSSATWPCVPEAQYLVDCVPVPPSVSAEPYRWWNLHGRTVWLIALFERLEREEHQARNSYAPSVNASSV